MSWDGISRRRFLHDALMVAVATQFCPGWGGGWIGPKTFVELVYAGVQEGASAWD